MGFYKSGKEDISEVKKDYSKNKLMTLILICLIVLITFVYFAISKWVENKFEFDKLGKAGGF